MLTRLLTFLSITLYCVSCINSTTHNDVVQYSLENYQILNEYDIDRIGTVRDAILYQKYIILTTANSNSCFHIIDTDSGNLIKSWGHKGRGSGEYLSIGRQISVKDSSLFFSDNGRKIKYTIPINDLLSSDYEQNNGLDYPYTIDFRPSKFLALNGNIVCLGAIKDMRLGLLDEKTGRIIPHDNYYMPHAEFIEGIYIGSVYQSLL